MFHLPSDTWDPDLDLWLKLRKLQETQRQRVLCYPEAPTTQVGYSWLGCLGLPKGICTMMALLCGVKEVIAVGTTGEQGTGLVVRKWDLLPCPAASQRLRVSQDGQMVEMGVPELRSHPSAQGDISLILLRWLPVAVLAI